MSFWSWGEPTPQDETQTASFWRWGETAAPTPTQPEPVAAAATAQDETRRPTFWWSEPDAPQPEPDARSTATYAAGDDAGALLEAQLPGAGGEPPRRRLGAGAATTRRIERAGGAAGCVAAQVVGAHRARALVRRAPY